MWHPKQENLITTLDIKLQMLGEQLLNGKIGGIVAIEPKTGEILAMVSSPTFNPSSLVGRQRTKNYIQLVSDPAKPLLNRSTQAQYSPGSTFKTIQALVCQQMGGIDTKTLFPCNGPESYPIKCTHHHGSPVNLLNGIEQSCNPYFWGAFRTTLEKDGYGEKNKNFKRNYQIWRSYVLNFGFGKKFTDGDIYQQSSGNIPTEKYFNRISGNRLASLNHPIFGYRAGRNSRYSSSVVKCHGYYCQQGILHHSSSQQSRFVIKKSS